MTERRNHDANCFRPISTASYLFVLWQIAATCRCYYYRYNKSLIKMKIKTANWQKFSPDVVIARNYAPSVRFRYWTVKNIISCVIYTKRKSTYLEWIQWLLLVTEIRFLSLPISLAGFRANVPPSSIRMTDNKLENRSAYRFTASYTHVFRFLVWISENSLFIRRVKIESLLSHKIWSNVSNGERKRTREGNRKWI